MRISWTTASGRSSTIKPAATKLTPRTTRSAGLSGSRAIQRPARLSGSCTSIGLSSEAAAAAITAPDPARIQAAVFRSPRKASQTAPAAACPSGVSTCPMATERRIPSASTRITPPAAAPTPRSMTVRRRSGERNSAAAPSASDSAASRIARKRILSAIRARSPPVLADVALEQLHLAGRVDLVGDGGLELLERGRQDRAHVGDRERDGVLVPVEDRPVHVPYARPEEGGERPAPDERRRGRLDDRPGRKEVALVLQDDLVRDLLGEERAHAVVAERGRGAVRELVRVDRCAADVAGDQRQGERHGSEDGQRPREDWRVHVPTLPAVDAFYFDDV